MNVIIVFIFKCAYMCVLGGVHGDIRYSVWWNNDLKPTSFHCINFYLFVYLCIALLKLTKVGGFIQVLCLWKLNNRKIRLIFTVLKWMMCYWLVFFFFFKGPKLRCFFNIGTRRLDASFFVFIYNFFVCL